MGNIEHIFNRFHPQRGLDVGFRTRREQATATVALHPDMGRGRKYAEEQHYVPGLHLALLVQAAINFVENSWKRGTVSNMMDMVNVFNEFFKEYLGLSMLWQPDTS